MTKKQLKIKLMPNGEIQMETIGIKGQKCLEYIPLMEHIADIKITEQKFTEEYYEQEEDIDLENYNIRTDY